MTDTDVSIYHSVRYVAPPAVFTPERPDWWNEAACLASDPDTFFPERGEDVRRAKEICRTCPVRGECLDYALTNNEKFGIWGGTSERERRRMNTPRGPRSQANEARQRQVQAMSREGIRPNEIARDLGITTRTVHRYLNKEAS